MFKSLTFDGENSLDYGVHINGEGVYNAPERDVEMISIPGRDGDYALDHGRFHNIDVTYPAGIGEMSQTDFADKIGAFRNALASRRGYCRLEDDYHTDEFRMGVYKSGLEASPVMYNRAGEFDLVFNCKPQRFLKTGEQATEFTQSGTINNPTLFEAKPLLELYGYGTLNVNGSEIVLHNDPLGNITLVTEGGYTIGQAITFDKNLVNTGDTMTLGGATIRAYLTTSTHFHTITGITSTTVSGADAGNMTVSNPAYVRDQVSYSASFNNSISFVCGTAKTYSATVAVVFNATTNGTSRSYTWTTGIQLAYDGTNSITVTITTKSVSGGFSGSMDYSSATNGFGPLTAESTVLPLGSPLYLDCEIGEAYKEENGQITLINKNVDIPSDLPVLSPGTNTITMDNTFTKVNVIPRWWII